MPSWKICPIDNDIRINRSPWFQYFMQDILLGRIGKDTAAYLDDIMIYTQKGTNHEDAVLSILDTLSKHQLWLKPEKCEFSRNEV